jgi:hypothetical protein
MNHHHCEHAATVTCIFTLSVLSECLSGCAHDESESSGTISNLPEGTFVSNLTGHSNTGLWNKKLGLGIRNESDMYIMVDRKVTFENIRAGDVIVFTQPGSRGLICHPVIAKGKGWIKTKGFNNAECDGWLITPAWYAGKVDCVAATGTGPWRSVPNLHIATATTTATLVAGAPPPTLYTKTDTLSRE